MHFFRSEMAISPIEVLLDKVHDAEEGVDEPDASPGRGAVPTIEQFLDEEDILRECRSENERLINYLCRPQVVRALVSHCVHVPEPASSILASAQQVEDADFGTEAEDSAQDDAQDQAQLSHLQAEDDEKKRYKFPYVASELLSADIKPLCDAVVGDDDVMDSIFACLEENECGHLNPLVASHFAKVIISLLKTHNAETLAQMARRKRTFIDGILKHLANGPIADLVVRVLDGPDADRSYSPTITAPTTAVLELLADADMLNGLADCFVRASNAAAAVPVVSAGGVGDDVDVDVDIHRGEGAVPRASEEESAQARRLREETMANASGAIRGLAERMLQLPALGVEIPDKLSPYATPMVVARLLDAGLFASGNLTSLATTPGYGGGEVSSDGDRSPRLAETFNSGCNSALLHSLGLAASLMTTSGNIVKDEEDGSGAGAMGHHGGGVVNRQMMLGMGRGAYSGRGIGPSVIAEGSADDDSDDDELPNDSALANEQAPVVNLLLSKKVGDPIVSTLALERELSKRFPRLSEMFGSNTADEKQMRPLGSLRLKLAEFFVACMKKAARETVDQIIELGVPKKLLELFLRYEWSSMLHGVITDSIVAALDCEEPGAPSRIAWFDAGLVPWLVEAWSVNDRKEEDEECRFRAGYMGHLIRTGASLKAFLDESDEETRHALVTDTTMDAFTSFASNRLAPAHALEITPLCGEQPAHGSGGSEGEEIYEEATEVFDMGMGDMIEGLTQGDANVAINNFAKYLLHKSDDGGGEYDDEVIETVDVGNLDHFGADDEDGEDVRPVPYGTDLDYDIPAAMRDQLSASSPSAPPGISDPMATAPSTQASDILLSAGTDDMTTAVADIDSSDEDDGSYEAFTDDLREDAVGDSLAAGVREKLQISSEEAGPAPLSPSSTGQEPVGSQSGPISSLDGIVTEIDDEVTPLAPTDFADAGVTGGAASTSAHVEQQPIDDSSDDEAGDWVAFSEEALTSSGDAPKPESTGQSAAPSGHKPGV